MAYIGNKVNGGLADGNAVVSGTLDVSNNVTLSADVTIGDDLVLTDDLFFGTDATVINFGADNDVTLTHVHDTGILLNSSKQLQFGDSGTYIRQSSDGVLNLVADGDMVITADGVVIGASSTATVFEATGSKNDQWAGKFTNTNSGGYGVLAVTAGSTANEKAFEVRKNTSDTAMLIQGDGKVGIGSSSPQNLLHLEASSGARMRFVDTGTQAYTLGNSGTSLTLNNASQSTTPLTITTSEAVFNDDSTDYDFRVESNGNANMLFVDAGNDVIKIGGDSSGFISNSVNIYGASVNPPGTTAGNLLVNSTDSMAADKGGSITLGGKYTSGGTMYHFGAIQAVKLNSSSGNAAGVFKAYVTNSSNGSNAFLEADETEVVFNEAGGNVDFRVEADANDNAFRVDAGANSGVGAVLFGQSSPDTTANGAYFSLSTANNKAHLVVANTETSNSLALVFLNRQQSDGALMQFRHEDSSEGSISVSGSTVSYNGFSGRHESSGIPTNTPVGTVVSTIDELDVYPNTTTDTEGNTVTHKKAGQTRADHAKVEISNSSGDTCVYGVVSEFDNDGKLIVTSVGIGSILVTGACNKGDLLESNGDGTAKVQSDDIIRSKTIGKVTIGNSSEEVKLVSCVLYCG